MSLPSLPSELFWKEIGQHLTIQEFVQVALTCNQNLLLISEKSDFLKKRAVELQLNISDHENKIASFIESSWAVVLGLERCIDPDFYDETNNRSCKWVEAIIQSNHSNLFKKLLDGSISFIRNLEFEEGCLTDETASLMKSFACKNGFYEAARLGREECLKLIINCDRFHEIALDQLTAGFYSTAWQGYEGCLKCIIHCSRFHQINLPDLEESFTSAASNDQSKCLKLIIDCNRFYQMSVKTLECGLKYALWRGAESCVKLIKESNRFHEIRS